MNAGKSRIYGVEIETSISPVKGFRVDASYTYLNATIRSIAAIVSTDPNYVASFQIAPGDSLVLSPKNKFAVTGSYAIPLDSHVGIITLGVTYSHTDKQLSNYEFNNPSQIINFGANFSILDLAGIWSISLLRGNRLEDCRLISRALLPT